MDDAVVLSAEAHEEIGLALREKLAGYLDDTPVPRWDLMRGDQFPNLHAAAGVRSSSAFRRGAKYVSVTSGDGQIILIPCRRDGRGFAEKKLSRSLSDTESDGRIGAAVLACFDVAE
ncbi:MAG: hypothetical protein ABL871_12530 [Terricaulis sp.]